MTPPDHKLEPSVAPLYVPDFLAGRERTLGSTVALGPLWMFTRFMALLLATISSVTAEEEMRSGPPKECYLYSYGKGPDWLAKVSVEFRLSLLNHQMPYVDDRYSEPTDKALTWTNCQTKPNLTTIATVNGRKVIRVSFPEKDIVGEDTEMVLLAIECAQNSEWFSPFFVGQPELFNGQFINGRDVALGYVVTLRWSGTGAYRAHYLFDLLQPHPRMIAAVRAGRVRRTDYKTDAEYEDALGDLAREKDLFAGRIERPKAQEPAR